MPTFATNLLNLTNSRLRVFVIKHGCFQESLTSYKHFSTTNSYRALHHGGHPFSWGPSSWRSSRRPRGRPRHHRCQIRHPFEWFSEWPCRPMKARVDHLALNLPPFWVVYIKMKQKQKKIKAGLGVQWEKIVFNATDRMRRSIHATTERTQDDVFH